MNREKRIQKRKKRYFVLILLVLFILFFILHRQITMGVFSPIIKGAYYHVETDTKAAALTFEAVWGAGQTDAILDILDRYQVRATFFVSGSWLRKYADVAREIMQRGHEIGQHGYDHKLMTMMSNEELARDFDQAKEAFWEELHIETDLFRPPFGELDQRVYDNAYNRGLTTVLWSVNSQDWLNLTHEEITDNMVKKMHKGAVILLHTHSSQTLKALPVIIERLRVQEYEIMTFSELRKNEVR